MHRANQNRATDEQPTVCGTVAARTRWAVRSAPPRHQAWRPFITHRPGAVPRRISCVRCRQVTRPWRPSAIRMKGSHRAGPASPCADLQRSGLHRPLPGGVPGNALAVAAASPPPRSAESRPAERWSAALTSVTRLADGRLIDAAGQLFDTVRGHGCLRGLGNCWPAPFPPGRRPLPWCADEVQGTWCPRASPARRSSAVYVYEKLPAKRAFSTRLHMSPTPTAKAAGGAGQPRAHRYPPTLVAQWTARNWSACP